MGKVLYRKYRSKSLDEIVGQNHITSTLKNAINSGKISHAYLLTGPRGVGKTSVARILAHAINHIPYTDDSTNMDIIEIDAASNRRIDEIRELRDKIHIAPTSLKYKVYIIDEVHMLTKEAFNALLKTLEEPPSHAIFILATTESHKVPETIISRTQRYSFKPLTADSMTGHLQKIAETEKIHISKDAIRLIAEHGDGSFRDSISLLDQVSNLYENNIEIAHVEQLLGIAPSEIIDRITNHLVAGTPQQAIDLMQAITEQGLSIGQLIKQLSEKLRNFLVSDSSPLDSQKIIVYLKALLELQSSSDQFNSFELFLLENSHLTSKPPTLRADSADEPEKMDSMSAIKTTQIKHTEQKVQTNVPIEDDLFKKILTELKKKHNTLYAVMRMTEPKIEESTMILQCHYGFHNKQLNDSKNMDIINKIAKEISNRDIAIKSVLVQKNKPSKPSKQPESATLNTINNIFGGGELLED